MRSLHDDGVCAGNLTDSEPHFTLSLFAINEPQYGFHFRA